MEVEVQLALEVGLGAAAHHRPRQGSRRCRLRGAGLPPPGWTTAAAARQQGDFNRRAHRGGAKTTRFVGPLAVELGCREQ
mmetsp:Transcript_42949/g.103477  ORF Transcript_42949/g.103477 Transcript_42949/m.103477 type:complete len:80 (-) Transcript_42949:334-573(-)